MGRLRRGRAASRDQRLGSSADGRNRTGGRPVHVPTGRQIVADPDALAVHVVGDAGPRGPNLRLPVDPDVLALGLAGLRDRALDCDLDAAGELCMGRSMSWWPSSRLAGSTSRS